MFTPALAVELREKINSVFYEGRVIPRHTEKQHFYEDVVDGQVYSSVTTKTGILSRAQYKDIASGIAVDYIQSRMMNLANMSPEEIADMFTKARGEHHVVLQQAADHGTFGHDIVDRYVQDWMMKGVRAPDIKEFITPEMSNQGICAGLSAMKFFDEYTVFPVVSEKKVLSKKHGYAGTLDTMFLVGSVYKEREGKKECKHNWFEKGSDKIACGLCGRQEVLELILVDLKTSNTIMDKYEYSAQTALYWLALKEMCQVNAKRIWILQLDKNQPKYTIGVIPDIKKAVNAGLAIVAVSDFANDKSQSIHPLNQKTRITL